MNLNLKKQILLSLFVFMISLSMLCPKANIPKTVALKEVLKPDMMLVKNSQLYILEGTSIFIYSLEDFHLIKKFGRQGEGPVEFMARPFGAPMTISFFEDKLVVNSSNKVSYFSLDGKYVTEEKSPPNTVFFRVKEGYLGIGPAQTENNKIYICYRLFDKEFKNPKILYQSEISLGQNTEFNVPMNALNYYPIYEDNIFIVEGKKGFFINCLDFKGNQLYEIEKKEFEKIEVTKTYKEKTMKWFQQDPFYKKVFPQIKDSIKFKEFFPPIKSISVDNDLLYIITNKTKDGLWECIVMNLKGKELKRVFVPLQDSDPFTYYPLLYFIEKGKCYSLKENQESDTWELFVTPVK